MSDDARYEAILARDRRFDGVFYVGVRTTGVYCRPICPARGADAKNSQRLRPGVRAGQIGRQYTPVVRTPT